MSSSKKKKEVVAKVPAAEKNGKTEMVNIFSTNYGYYRYFVREILQTGGILKFRFVKNKENYSGQLAIAKTEVDKAKKVLAEYQKKNPEVKAMWT